MTTNREPFRNRHGVELKPGNWFMGADEYGHKEGIIDRVAKSGQIVELNGGPSVVYATAPGEHPVHSILADNVMQTLGPMVIEGDGTVKQNPRKRLNKSDTPPDCYFSHSGGMWRLIYQGMPLNADTPDLDRVRKAAQQFKVKTDPEFWDGDSGTWRPFPNPLTRVKRNSPSQRGDGTKPAKGSRLYNRRKTTEAAPPGFYANPTPRLERADQDSQRERFNPKTGKMTKRASPRLKERRALTHYAKTPGVWANPMPKHYGSKSAAKWILIEVQKPGDKRFKRHATFEHKPEATMYARALHNAHPAWAIRVSDES